MFDELWRETLTDVGAEIDAEARDIGEDAARLHHTFGKAVDHRRVGKIAAVGIEPINGRHRQNLTDGFDDLVFAQAAAFNDGFGRLHADNHRRGGAADGRRMPVEFERDLQFGCAAG